VQHKQYYKRARSADELDGLSGKRQTLADWHTDISFEPVPADFSSLRLVQLPRTGGDTLWASGYELYDRLSAPYQRFLEGLTATFEQTGFKQAALRGGFELHPGPRGAPQNVGTNLRAVHPVVRTNPVTGWKSLFPVGEHVKHINGVTQEESDHLLRWFLDLVYRNHDLQVRFKWQNPNDLGEWVGRVPDEGPSDNEPPDTDLDLVVQPSGTTAAPSTRPRGTTRARASATATAPSASARSRSMTRRVSRGARRWGWSTRARCFRRGRMRGSGAGNVYLWRACDVFDMKDVFFCVDWLRRVCSVDVIVEACVYNSILGMD
jgi:hypothetical protein